MRGLHEEGCWIPRHRVTPLYRAGNHFLQAYQFMAYKTLSRGQTHFSMIPKLHMFHHLMEEMEFQSVRAGWAWNCLIDACYQEEDFVGRTSYLTRCVSIRCQVVRTLYRYLAQLNVCLSVKWDWTSLHQVWVHNELLWERGLVRRCECIYIKCMCKTIFGLYILCWNLMFFKPSNSMYIIMIPEYHRIWQWTKISVIHDVCRSYVEILRFGGNKFFFSK